MASKIYGLLILLAVVSSTLAACEEDDRLPKDQLFPSGLSTGDRHLPRVNNAYVELNLKSPLTYYGKKYSSIFINDNGVLSFVNAAGSFKWQELPLPPMADKKNILIAPFMANIDLAVTGNIYYRETTDSAELERAVGKVRQYFVRNSEFQPSSLLIVTWDKVGFFGSAAPSVVNTFQCVVVSDTVSTFVFFLYQNITWITDVGSGGNQNTGIGAQKPQVGFDAGDSRNNEIYDLESLVDGALDLPCASNVDPKDPPGFFIYKVSGSKVESPKCGPSEPLQLYPDYAGMFGGTKVTVGGFCFSENDVIEAEFGTAGKSMCTYVSRYQASCVVPRMNSVGDVVVTLSEGSRDMTGTMRIMPLTSQPPTVSRTDPYERKWLQSGNQLQITWDRNSLVSDLVNINILSYKAGERNETTNTASPEWVETVIAVNVSNSGRYSFTSTGLPDIDQTNAMGVFRISASSKPDGVTLTGDLHFLGYLIKTKSYQDNPEEWSQEYCRDWFDEDQYEPAFAQDVNACPCTLQQALADQARFVANPWCDSTLQSPEGIKALDFCFARPGIKHCALDILQSPTRSASECCYDGDDNLVYAQDSIYGSFSNRVSRFSGTSPPLGSVTSDLVPYMFCIVVGSDPDHYYQRARPTRDCKDYKPVRPAIVYGDPHFVTFDNMSYTFNGYGEYVLLKTKDATTKTEFRMEGRFERVMNSEGNAVNATVLTTLAIRESNNEDNRIQIEANDITKMNLRVGQTAKLQDIGNSRWQQYGNFLVIFPGNTGTGVISKMVFLFKQSQIGIVVEAGDQLVCSMVLLPEDFKGLNEIEGLLGSWDGDMSNDLKDPEGNTLPKTSSSQTIFSDFGQKWEAFPPTIFTYIGDKFTHGEYQFNDFTPIFNPPDDVPSRELKSVCGEDEACIFDYQMTGLASFAAHTRMGSEMVQKTMAASNKVLMCPYIPTPARGSKTFVEATNHAPGSVIEFKCDDGYIFLGESHRECKENQQWSDASVPSCLEVKCGTLDPPSYGNMKVEVKGEVITATFRCDNGAEMTGSATRVCGADEKWTGEETKCTPPAGSNTAVIVVVVIIVIVVIVAVVVLGVYCYKKKQVAGSQKVTRPPDSAYQPVETTAAGEGGDVEMGAKNSKSAEDDGGFSDKPDDRDLK
ncbi:sushi domain-containing protein 2-like [Asterias amurensis]|uniref:sushi domain-containing protein 2-like n=1 Tax=Asterias amurensis TaxID=7602 RepID=UPI003AB316AF